MTLSVALRHRFAGHDIAIGFEAPSPGVTALFGRSGAGKSTTLAVIAGLLRPDHCRIEVDGVVLADTAAGVWVPAERRRVGMVFQDARLFPHMSVATNLRFGLRRAGPGAIGFDDVVALLGIGGLLERRPHTLSGGERQRVAIGRALLSQPRLLLLDEPLSGLDGARKAEILPYLARLKAALRLPMIYVSHAPDEVLRLADTLVLLRDGQVVGAGPVAEIAARGDLPFSRRDDAGALLLGRVLGHAAARGLTRIEGGGVAWMVPLLDLAVGAACRMRIPAREVILAGREPEAISVQNIVAGTVRHISDEGMRHSALVEVGLPAGALLARVTPDAVARLGLVVGGPVLALVKSTAIEVLAG